MFVIVDLQMMFHIKTQVFHDGYNVSINKCLPTFPNLRKRLVKCNICVVASNDNETRKLWKLDQEYLEMFEMWYCRRIEKISWTDHVTNEDVLQRVKKERNILQTTTKEVRLTGMVTSCVGTVS
jgi:DNA phosphorothioation-dependent restriction protein DptG